MAIRVDLRGMPETQRLLSALSGQMLQNRTRRSLRAGAAIFRDALRAEASSRTDLPRSFRRTATKGHRNPLGVSVGPTSPLINIFEPGAEQHRIGAPGQLLSNLEGRRSAGPSQGAPFMARGPVTHPGFGARPFIDPVFESTEHEASEKVMDTMFEGLH